MAGSALNTLVTFPYLDHFLVEQSSMGSPGKCPNCDEYSQAYMQDQISILLTKHIDCTLACPKLWTVYRARSSLHALRLRVLRNF